MGDPVTRVVGDPPGVGAAGPPIVSLSNGTDWVEPTPAARKRNVLDLDLENVEAGRIDGDRAGLDGDQPLRIDVRADGPGRLILDLQRGNAATLESGDGAARRIDIRPGGYLLRIGRGEGSFRITPN